VEKRKPTFDLTRLKAAFARVTDLGAATTATAFRDAQELGFSRDDMIEAIQSLRASDFYKSMTAYANPRLWQDVYRVRFRGQELYVKFTSKPGGGYVLLSFKEK
jgi:motility quorum-sensing regulator / GCU-specific mRNA interferase toxin